MEVLDINLLGASYTGILALSAFGTIPVVFHQPLLLFTSSGAGLYPVPVSPLYGAAKHGVISLALLDHVDQELITPITQITAAI